MTDQYGGGPEYNPVPPPPPLDAPVERGEAPAPVVNAVRLMFVRAAFGVISVIVLLATKDTLKSEILKKNLTADPQRLDSLLNTVIVVGIVFGLIFVVLYIALALQVGKGKNWARVVSWVLAGLGILSALLSLAQPQAGLTRVSSLISGVIDIAIVVLLAQRASNEYFRRRF